MTLFKNRKRWMREFDAEAYLHDRSLPDGIPKPFVSLIEQLTQVTEQHYREQLVQNETRYQALQSQINPHFLYNTLECIRSEAISVGNTNIASMTEALSCFFRYNISAREDMVTLRDELLALQDYFFIQHYRFGDRFRLVTDIREPWIYNSYLPKITLQPIVENALFYGLSEKKEGGTVTIRAKGTEQAIHLWVSDDGCGMSQDQVVALNQSLLRKESSKTHGTAHTGIALTNVNARIKLRFGQDYGLRVMSLLGKGTDVEIVYPYWSQLPEEGTP